MGRCRRTNQRSASTEGSKTAHTSALSTRYTTAIETVRHQLIYTLHTGHSHLLSELLSTALHCVHLHTGAAAAAPAAAAAVPVLLLLPFGMVAVLAVAAAVMRGALCV